MDIGPRVGHPDPVAIRVLADRRIGKTVKLRQTTSRQLIRQVAFDDQYRTVSGSCQAVDQLRRRQLVAIVAAAVAGGQQE